ncbi:glycosyltransferase family 4 protein [Paraburkholderia aspalathi]|nr:glycosyltransferase family 4 protein [Paraburkholderia aspalathi]
MRCAYFVRPHMGGTYSVFRQLRDGLLPKGFDLRWLATGNADVPANRDLTSGPNSHLDNDRALGDWIDADGQLTNIQRAHRLIAFLEENHVDAVFINVLADRFETNIARYLPAHILRIMIVHTITPSTYAAARAIRDHVHATICVSERAHFDLVQGYGFDDDRILTVCNAVRINQTPLPCASREPGTLRLLSLGRIDDTSKGVFWLPKIMEHLGAQVTLTIAGDGPDLQNLRDRFQPFGERVKIIGGVPHDQTAALFANHDVFVMPSRFEGSPMALIEAMAAGCVPVASHIRSVTDTLVDHGQNGLLFAVGNCREAASCIEKLRKNPDLLDHMATAARQKTAAGFSVETMAEAYGGVLSIITAAPPEISPALPISQWSMPAGLRDPLRTHLPRPVKNWLRVIRERLLIFAQQA